MTKQKGHRLVPEAYTDRVALDCACQYQFRRDYTPIASCFRSHLGCVPERPIAGLTASPVLKHHHHQKFISLISLDHGVAERWVKAGSVVRRSSMIVARPFKEWCYDVFQEKRVGGSSYDW
jgi:hypothetical protein